MLPAPEATMAAAPEVGAHLSTDVDTCEAAEALLSLSEAPKAKGTLFRNNPRIPAQEPWQGAAGFKRTRSHGNGATEGASALTFAKKPKGCAPQNPPGSVFSPANSVESQGRSSSSQNTHSIDATTDQKLTMPEQAYRPSSPRNSREDSSTTHAKNGTAALDFAGAVGLLAQELGETKVEPLISILRNAVALEQEQLQKQQHAGPAPLNATGSIPSSLAAAIKMAQPPGDAAEGSNEAVDKLQGAGMTRSQALMESPSMSAMLLMADRRRGVNESSYRLRAPVLASSSSVQSLSGRHSQDLSGETAQYKSPVKAVPANGGGADSDKPPSGGSMASSTLNKVFKPGHSLAASYKHAMLSKHAQPPSAMAPPVSRAMSADRSGISSYCQYGGNSSKLSPTSPLVHASSAGGSFAAYGLPPRNPVPMDPPAAMGRSSLADNYSRLMEAKRAQGVSRLEQTLRSALSDPNCLHSLGTKLSASNLSSMLAKVSSAANPGFAQALAMLNERGGSPSKLERIASHLSEGHALSPKHLEMIEESRRQADDFSGDKYVPPSVLHQARSFASSDARSHTAPVDINPQTLASLLLRHVEQPAAALAPQAMTCLAPPPAPLLAGYNAAHDRTLPICHTAAGRAYFTQIATSVAAFADKVEGGTIWSDSLKHGGCLRFRNAICKMAWFLLRKRARMEGATAQPPPALPPLHPVSSVKAEPGSPGNGAEVSSAVLMLAELCKLQQHMAATSQWHQPVAEQAPLSKPSRGTPLPGRSLPLSAQKA